ncbi:galactokinase [Anaerobacterium chartisolvens]|uniref:Galactokinase n=1 Tax=Anaerobacterium chartisolvens TaxID=1297424 RepID=A0A369B189_9FIRM|nr:galactokinase [Anaerobacterium chartisolvens]RCX13484.1 galactokinase [Anaerobacterium chartisolvens]
MTVQELKQRFIEIYGGDESGLAGLRVFSSPGRVNLIGEHTDYNGGFVFPAALTLASTVVVRRRNDRRISLTATDLPGVMVTASLDELDKFRSIKWGNYQLGVADELQKAGYKLIGCDILFHDTVPLGSGLSSSAAIEVVTALTLATLGNEASSISKEIDMVEMAKISQLAENNFIGVKCGIMDQFASAMGKADNAIFLNCRDLSYNYVPLDIKGFKIVLSNTKKKRSLAAVKYNERRAECEAGLELLKQALPEASCLGEISRKQFEAHKLLIKDEVVRKRVEHVICEDDRVLLSVEALKQGDIKKFGEYMNQSHDSLKYLYEVTGEELDTLVEEAVKIDGVIGSRMTGAGFGGCTVSIVAEDSVERFINEVGEAYFKRIGHNAEFYVSDIGDGGREIK